MQKASTIPERCRYPGCTSHAPIVTCAKCQKDFCRKHVHRRWKKSICEFCFLMEQAQGSQQQKIQRIGYIVCALLTVSGVLVLILGWNDVLGEVLLIGGIYGLAAVPTFRRLALRPTRASDIDANAAMQRVFGYRDDQ